MSDLAESSVVDKSPLSNSNNPETTIPKPRDIKSLQALIRMKPKSHHQWCVMAVALNRDILRDDGKVDDLYAMVFLLGSFELKEDAEKHAKKLIEQTGHNSIFVARYATPIPIGTATKNRAIEQVMVDKNGKLLQLEESEYQHQIKQYEERLQTMKELNEESNNESDPDSIEHFKRTAYTAVNAWQSYMEAKETMERNLELYEKSRNSLKTHYAAHPEHENQWLPLIKERLVRRGQGDLYRSIAMGYAQLRDQLLK